MDRPAESSERSFAQEVGLALLAAALVFVFMSGLPLGLANAETRTAAQAGTFDLSFGEDGIGGTFIKDYGMLSGPTGIAERPSGGVVQAVLASKGGLVVGYTRRGRIDRKFGVDGIAPTKFSTGFMNPRDLLADRKGRIVVAGEGHARSSRRPFGVALGRLLPNGDPDPTFANRGFAFPKKLRRAIATSLVFYKGGRIVVAGYRGGIPDEMTFIARYLANGKPDRSFSSDGIVFDPVDRGLMNRGVAVDSRGRIVVGTTVVKGALQRDPHLKVLRFKPSGDRDRRFNGNARVASLQGPLNDLTIDRQGRIVVGLGGTHDGVIARLSKAGRRDPSFGTKGVQPLSSIAPESVSVDRKRRINVVGARYADYGEPSGRMVRLKPSGELDSKFEDRASAMWFYTDHFLDSRDRIVAGGIAGEIGVAVARVFNP